MFQSFYLSRRWLPWAFPGAALILFATWYKVERDVKINEWFGDFYNLIQKALGPTETITMDEYMQQLAKKNRAGGQARYVARCDRHADGQMVMG